jgi:site-specific recombinase XerD
MARKTANVRMHAETALVPASDPRNTRALAQRDALTDKQAAQLHDLFSKHALAANTRRAYEQGWRDFGEFCMMHRYRALPADQTVIAAYLNWLSGHSDPKTGLQRGESLKFSTISLRQNAIAWVHDMKNLGVDGYQNPARSKLVTSTLSAIRRKLEDAAAAARTHRPASRTPVRHERDLLTTQVRALTLADMDMILKALPHESLSTARDRALLLVGYAGAFRRSELVAIEFADLTFHDDGVDIRVRRSKSDQRGIGEDKTIIRLDAEMVRLCPVVALESWLAELGAQDVRSGSVFRRIFKNKVIGKSGLSDKAVEQIVRKAVFLSDLPHPVAAYAGHSLRAGFVTQALENGANPLEIIEVTKHKNIQMVQRYARPTKDRRKRSALAGFAKREEKIDRQAD